MERIERMAPRTVRAVTRSTLETIRGIAVGLPILLLGISSPPPVRLHFGHRVPRRSDRAHGGIVKMQGLQDFYPAAHGRFNVLYLVSSRPPAGARAIVALARFRGAKLVWNQDGVAYPAWHGPGWQRTNARLAALLHRADHVFYQSAFCEASADRFLGPPTAPSEILYNAVDTRFFTPGDPPSGPPVLLLGGTQYQWYRFETALRVLREVRREHPNATLTVTGHLWWRPQRDIAEREARALARALGLEDAVRLLGPYRQIDAPAIFRSAHILLHTKVNDPCPTVVIEAMSCGLPVIHSRSGGVPELVGDDAGIAVRSDADWEREVPPDPAEMGAAVVAALDRRTELAAAARARAVERFDLRAWIDRHRVVFEGLA